MSIRNIRFLYMWILKGKIKMKIDGERIKYWDFNSKFYGKSSGHIGRAEITEFLKKYLVDK